MQSQLTTFLLLEDDPNDVFFVELAFKTAPKNIHLRHVRDGVEGIEYLEGKGKYADRHKFPIPQVILMDLKMPRLNGFEFLEWLRNKAPNHLRPTPAIVMSSSSMESDILRCYQLGANCYLIKPVDWKQFQERIRTLGILWSEHVETLRMHP